MATKEKPTKYTQLQIAGRIAQLLGWLQLVFATIVILGLTNLQISAPLRIPIVLGYIVVHFAILVTLLLQGRKVEHADPKSRDWKDSLKFCTAAILVAAIFSYPNSTFVLMYIVVAISFIYAYNKTA